MSKIFAVPARLAAGLSAFAVGLALSSAAMAQAAPGVEHSGNVFHVRVCPGPAGPGTARCHAHVVTDRSGKIITNAAPAAGSYGPADLRAAYNVAPGTTGPLIAIVDAYGYPNAERDLNVYRSQYGLPPCTSSLPNPCFTKVNQTGGTKYPKSNTNWDLEQALDLEMVSAICPECRILLVEASSASYSNLAAAENQAAKLGAVAISNSYGGGEAGTSSYNKIYCNAAAYSVSGIAITVSSGDSGYAAGPQFPASSPCVTAVGGTSLVHSNSTRGWTETVWSGAGSGCSTVYSKPQWQFDPDCSKRMVADVSAVGDPNTGVAVYGPVFGTFSGWITVGGTSVGAPLIAAIYGLNGGTVNYGSNPYPLYPPSPPGTGWPYATNSHLNVITSGSNGSCNGSYFCTAGAVANYSGPTGLGTPNGAAAF
jgi:subtilase family serine protease